MAKKTIDVTKYGSAGTSTLQGGGKGGKVSEYGNVRETICKLIAQLCTPSADGAYPMDTFGESNFAALKRDLWGADAPTQSLRVYVGHYNRLEHGYGPDVAYTLDEGKRVLRQDARKKHLNSAPRKPVWDIPCKPESYKGWFAAQK